MPRITLRQIAATALVAGPVGAAILTAAVTVGWVSAQEAFLLAVTGMILAALGILAIGLRQVDARVKELLGENRKQAELLNKDLQGRQHQLRKSIDDVATLLKDVRGGLDEEHLELLTHLTRVGERLGHLDRQVTGLEKQATGLMRQATGLEKQATGLEKQVTGLEDAVERLPSRLVKPVSHAVDGVKARQAKLHERLYAKVEARANLRELITPRAPMPLLGGWALDADIMHMIVMMLWERRPELIVECGSGTSSLWLGYVAERMGTGRVIALEHDERYLRASRELIRAHALEETVEIRHAPLETWSDKAGGDEQYLWYASSALEDLKGIGLLLVDGPPAATGPQARYPAGPLLLPRCTDDVVIILDDADRPDENALSDRWLDNCPELERTVLRYGSAHVLQRRKSPNSRPTT